MLVGASAKVDRALPTAMVPLLATGPATLPKPASVAPRATVVTPPPDSAAEVWLGSPTTSVPASTLVGPVYVLLAVSMVMPLPISHTPPVPEITPGNVTVSHRSKASVPLSVTLPTMTPVVPPLPSCRVPALMVVPPV